MEEYSTLLIVDLQVRVKKLQGGPSKFRVILGCSAFFLSAQNSEHYARLPWKVADPEGAGPQELVDGDPHQGVDAFTLGRELGAQRLGPPLLPMEVRERHSPVIYDHLKPRGRNLILMV